MQNFKSEPKQAAQAVGPQPDTRTLEDESAHLKEENERLTQELQREHEMYICNLADFNNYRRRAERERAQAAQAGKRAVILPLLDVLDDFERALQHAHGESPSLVTGLQAIHRRLVGLLAAEGVTPFESRGEYFDPLRHEALASVEDESAQPGIIVDEFSRGWRWGDEVLRPARVRVAQ